MIEVTVALPTWKSSEIIWLQLDSLCRQETDVEWELFVDECESEECWDVLQEYKDRLRKAGCVNVAYNSNSTKVPLGLKWRNIARLAQGKCLVLAASDNYSPPDRVQRARDVLELYDWTDSSYGLFYNISTGKQATWTRLNPFRSGLWMACRSELLKDLGDDPPEKCIDSWIKSQLPEDLRWWRDEEERMGVHTDGMNTISETRAGMYAGVPRLPFVPATQDVKDILPGEVMDRLCVCV